MQNLLQQANQEYRNGNYQQALALYDAAYDNYPFKDSIAVLRDRCLKHCAAKPAPVDLRRAADAPAEMAQTLHIVVKEEAGEHTYRCDSSVLNYLPGKALPDTLFPIAAQSHTADVSLAQSILIEIETGSLSNRQAWLKELVSLAIAVHHHQAPGFDISFGSYNDDHLDGHTVIRIRTPYQVSATRDLGEAATGYAPLHAMLFETKKKLQGNLVPQAASNRQGGKLAFDRAEDFISQCLSSPYVLNLSHRTDRRKAAEYAFSALGIKPNFIHGVNGKTARSAQRHWEQHLRYTRNAQSRPTFKYDHEIDFYIKYASTRQREDHYLGKNGKLLSQASLGYMLSYRKALIQALTNTQSKYILICDDDIIIHKNHLQLIERIVKDLPAEFKILSLGAIQYNWNSNILNRCGESLYQCFGTSIASHATVYDRSVAIELLDEIEKMSLPFDVGALHYLKKKYFHQSYVAYPNLFIQDSSESEIADTQQQLKTGTQKDNKYRWELTDYLHYSAGAME
ncbi:Glycosyltransferase family 25 (LPS biosynthesis protein) [Chromobacterium violaceum]|uniref:Glycosyltransferase family 25 (LPS biosynthesis protein) n=1 Tax=Chromobacterium violaceum TaxID=536 RepID=A0A3S4HIM4_CHRVL|nr:Glycosyltransferase family 25 (LPS biosynthesis protein) [Chromobacterium violaceum]